MPNPTPKVSQPEVTREEIAARNVHLKQIYDEAAKDAYNGVTLGKEALDKINAGSLQDRIAYNVGKQAGEEARVHHDNAPHATDKIVGALRLAGAIPVLGIIPDAVATAVDTGGAIAHGDSPERVLEVIGSGTVNTLPFAGNVIAVESLVQHKDILPDHAGNRLRCGIMPDVAKEALSVIGVDCDKYSVADVHAKALPNRPPASVSAQPKQNQNNYPHGR